MKKPPRRFTLGPEITREQAAFLDAHGYLVFDAVASATEVAALRVDLERLHEEWIRENRRQIFGVPIFEGRGPEGLPFLQRMPFTSCFSPAVATFVHDPRFEPVRRLVGENARVGDREKDGVVHSRYLNVRGSGYRRLGWHTDGLRDLFYLRMPRRMLNVGLHLDDCPAAQGGLRVIPGTHRQGFWSTCFRKPYFVSHGADPEEVAIETRAGDLTVHDGRLWHRVQQSPDVGWASLRRVLYVPYLSDAPQPKHEGSPTPAYLRLGLVSFGLKRAWADLLRRRAEPTARM